MDFKLLALLSLNALFRAKPPGYELGNP